MAPRALPGSARRSASQVPSVPDDIPEVGAEQLAEWLKHGTAVVLDCRERIEAQYERRSTWRQNQT